MKIFSGWKPKGNSHTLKSSSSRTTISSIFHRNLCEILCYIYQMLIKYKPIDIEDHE